MTGADVSGRVPDQELPAPYIPVLPVAGSVENYAAGPLVNPVLEQAGREVRVVVLNGGCAGAELGSHPLRGPGGQVLRVHVVGDHVGLQLVQPHEVLQRPVVVLQRLPLLHIPQVLPREQGIPPQEAEAALHLGTGAKHDPVVLARQPRGHRQRGVAPAPAKQKVGSADHGRDRVVYRHVNYAVGKQEKVDDPRQPRQRLRIVRDDGSVGEVGARHHQRPLFLEQKVVQRSVGKHHPERPLTGCDQPRHAHRHPGAAEHDRRGGGQKQPPRR